MARRDYRHRQPKKAKKSEKKVVLPTVTAPLSVEPEVVRKKKPADE